MEKNQKLGVVGALGLPVLAGALLAMTPATASAGPLCYYAGQSYSTGACLDTVCSYDKVQRCDMWGNWTNCTTCGDEDPPPL